MAENSKIEWCDHTFNPWIGCQKVGPGCDNCYAEAQQKRFGYDVYFGVGNERRRTRPANWKLPLKWNRKAEKEGVRYRVFCASLADVFDNAVPAQWRVDLFNLIESTPHLDWLLLTKRIGNVQKMLKTHDWLAGQKNVWLGITVCNQDEADRDIPKLLDIPAEYRFLSIEPLLGPIDLNAANGLHGDPGQIDWVIVGGESGSNARPMHPDWVRLLRNRCIEAGVPFFFKQWGEWHPNCLCDKSTACKEISRPQPGKRGVMFKCGKHSGRKLDSRIWNEVPKTSKTPELIPCPFCNGVVFMKHIICSDKVPFRPQCSICGTFIPNIQNDPIQDWNTRVSTVDTQILKKQLDIVQRGAEILAQSLETIVKLAEISPEEAAVSDPESIADALTQAFRKKFITQEVQAAIERATAKKPIKLRGTVEIEFKCPGCSENTYWFTQDNPAPKVCPECGQRLNWSHP